MKKLSIYLLYLCVLTGATQLTGCKQSGCMDPAADNYDPDASKDDGSCTYLNYELAGTISQPRTLTDRFDDPTRPDYLLVGDLEVAATLTIQPGVVIQANENTLITVTDGGAINAVGTSAKRIRFIGHSTIAGSWGGLKISSSNTANRLEYVDLVHAGSSWNAGGALTLDNDAKIAVVNTAVEYSGSDGISATYEGAIFTEFANNSFANIEEFPVSIYTNQIKFMDNGSTFDAATITQNYIEVFPAVASQPLTWKKTKAPYLLTSPLNIVHTFSADVSIESGTDIVLDDYCSLFFDAPLTAQGTASSPILFRGRVATSGFGGSIFITTAGSVMNYCEISYLGNPQLGNDYGMITIENTGALTASNSTFSGSGVWAIWVRLPGIFNDGGGNTFTGNASGNIGS